jgi:hypothetical protein
MAEIRPGKFRVPQICRGPTKQFDLDLLLSNNLTSTRNAHSWDRVCVVETVRGRWPLLRLLSIGLDPATFVSCFHRLLSSDLHKLNPTT